MNASSKQLGIALVFAGSLLSATAIYGQAPAAPPPAPSQAPGDKPAPAQAMPLTLDSTPPPVNAEEEAAVKGFRDEKNDNPEKKDQLANTFLEKYPQSRYRAELYSWQVKYYFSKGQVEKMEATGDKQLELTPNDPQTLAIVGSAIPRAMNAQTVEPQKRLAKAEQYCQRALDLLPTLAKPAEISDEVFSRAKDQTAALAYSGLGVVAFRRGKFDEAIPDFDKSVRLDPQPDPVNFYLLGFSNEKASHFDEAVAAFTKCAAIPSAVQGTCTQSVEEAKKLGLTHLSAPK